jgi:hypothetical protein
MMILIPNQPRSCSVTSAMGALLLGVVVLLSGTRTSAAQVTPNQHSFVGIWKMTVQGKRTGTLELMNYNGRLTGSITNGHADIDNGKLVRFDAIPGAAPIVQASISGDALIITTEEENESLSTWNMTLTGAETGLLQFAVKGHELGPFQISKISWAENEEDSESSAK